jgi:hypothetical protein
MPNEDALEKREVVGNETTDASQQRRGGDCMLIFVGIVRG